MKRLLLLGLASAVVSVTLVALLAGGGTAAASSTVNVSGIWQSTYDCSTGCGGGTYPDTITLTQASGSDTVTGTDQADSTVSGTINGSALSFTLVDGSYSAYYTLTIAANGQSWSGTVSDSNGTSGTDTATLQVAPVVAQSGTAAPVSGTVLVKVPGAASFETLSSASSIPIGSTINATNGTVGITVALPSGATQSGNFYDGEFTLGQKANGVTTEKLTGGSFGGCPSVKGARVARTAAAKKTAKTVVRKLWGSAHGSFTTSGKTASAAVLGTIWLTEDRCDGTYFKAVKDSITVTPFAHPGEKHVVKQGQSYFVP